jgi:alcohol dehydrogenase
MYSHCVDGAWILGNRIDGTQADYVRIPHAELCEELVGPGGTIANNGVHGTRGDLHLERLWSHNITITTPQLLKAVTARRLAPATLVSHRFRFDQVEEAYDTFGRAAATGAIKVIIEP